MKIYARKIMNHDITHEIGLTKNVVEDFFENEISLKMSYKGNEKVWNITINNNTDYRFGGSIKEMLKANGDVEENDIIVIEKNKDSFVIEIIKPSDKRYDTFDNIISESDRHLLIELDEASEDVVDINKQYTEEELGIILKEYRNLFPNALSAATHLFGLRYGKIIKNQKISQINIVRFAGIPDSLKDELNKGIKLSEIMELFPLKNKKEYKEDISNRVRGGYNKIIYGVPGTGKSYKIDQELIKEKVKEENKIRVTFHPEYTYNDFVGQLVPRVKENGEISYEFQPGQFTKALKRAYECPNEKIYLVIEEMSRGNCAAIFGDIFQLLDRETSGDYKDWSRYEIDNEVIAREIGKKDSDKIRIPSNLFIYGTVNTSDQNVFVMDTAFKRRFEWDYLSTKPLKNEKGELINNVKIEVGVSDEISEYDREFPKTKTTNWINLFEKLNEFITSKDKLDLGEDKQIGQFFIKFEDDEVLNKAKIKNKLLNYLWFDINEASYKNDIKLFDDKIKSFSDLYDKFENDKKIFSDKFIEFIKEQ